ncbi:MAG: insulinase family protein [Hymenobacteraceae bacterium]|nr:insulinase family protein [Hymenobacteraceae bacterium]MDX5397967.1 insulinase family protein [Hymenobacteraceae bacterium]MDX5443431.1 insulinase family protein [Hymenobacteraceae bacterium]MDX5514039.1 insulinase family protein [Hymenobacteraceae bacterium]
MKKIIFSLLFALVCAWPALAQQKTPPPPGPAPKIELGKYEYFELKNGLKVYVVQNRKLPVVTMSLILDRDPVKEGDKAGYVDIAGQMMRTGTKTRTKDQLDEEIDFIGAYINTSATGFSASALKKHLPKLMELTNDVVLNPNFKQEELDKLKKQTISGIVSSKDNPDAIQNQVQSVMMYGKDHPYGEIPTEKTIENIQLSDITAYYNNYFKPNIGYLAIVGDINKREAKKLVNKYFKNWQAGEVKNATFPAVTLPNATKVAVVDRPASVQTVIAVANPAPLAPGSPDAIAARVMNTILGGSFMRLDLNLREKNGFAYGANSSLSSDKIMGQFMAFSSVRNPVTDSAVAELLFELNRIRNEKVSDDELNRVKGIMMGSFARSLEDPKTVAQFAINTARYNLPADYYANYLKNLQALTPADIQAVAQKYIKPDQAYIIAVGNANEIADKLKKFNKEGQLAFMDNYGNKVERRAMPVPAGVTAETVLAAYIKALGGKEKIEKVKDLTVKSTIAVQGMNLDVTQSQKGTDKFFMEMKMGAMPLQQVVINGEKGKLTAQGQSQEISGDMLAEQKLRFDSFVESRYDKLGVQKKLVGMEDINGKMAYLMEVTLPGGKKVSQYFDKDSGLKVKEVASEDTPNGPISQTVTYTDYKEVNGIKFPHTTEMVVGPQVLKTQVSSIDINKGIKDDQFKL